MAKKEIKVLFIMQSIPLTFENEAQQGRKFESIPQKSM